jgi:hypothetical protein
MELLRPQSTGNFHPMCGLGSGCQIGTRPEMGNLSHGPKTVPGPFQRPFMEERNKRHKKSRNPGGRGHPGFLIQSGDDSPAKICILSPQRPRPRRDASGTADAALHFDGRGFAAHRSGPHPGFMQRHHRNRRARLVEEQWPGMGDRGIWHASPGHAHAHAA